MSEEKNIKKTNSEISEKTHKKVEKLRALAIRNAENEEMAKAIEMLSDQQILQILNEDTFSETDSNFSDIEISEEVTDDTCRSDAHTGESTQIEENAYAEENTQVEENAYAEENTQVEENAHAEENTQVEENVHAEENTHAEENAHLKKNNNFYEEQSDQEEETGSAALADNTMVSETDTEDDREADSQEAGIEKSELKKEKILPKNIVAIIVAMAVVIIGLCAGMAGMYFSYSAKIDGLEQNIAKNSKTIIAMQEENNKLKNRTEDLQKIIKKAKAKKEAARKAARAKTNKDMAEAQKNTSAIAIYNTADTGVLTKSKGAVYYKGHKETYYSSRVLRHKDIGSWRTDAKGVYRDADGYICVASNSGDLSAGQLVLTSMGIARVHDSGCAKGTIDLYVNW